MSIELLLHCEELPPVDTSLNEYTVTCDGDLSTTHKWGTYGTYLAAGSVTAEKLTVVNSDWGLGANDWTLDFWMRMTIGVANHIVAKGYSVYDPNVSFALYYNGSGGNIYVNDSSSTSFGASISSFSALGVTSSTTFYHYSIARNGQYIYVVINGVLAATVTLASASTPLHENTSYNLTFNQLPLSTRDTYLDEICFKMGEYVDFVGNIPTGAYTDPEPVDPIYGDGLGALQELQGYAGEFSRIGNASGSLQETTGSATVRDFPKAFAIGSLKQLSGSAAISPRVIITLKQLLGSATAYSQKIGNAAGKLKELVGSAIASTPIVGNAIGKAKELTGSATAITISPAYAFGRLQQLVGSAGEENSTITCLGSLKQLSGMALISEPDPFETVRFVRGRVRK